MLRDFHLIHRRKPHVFNAGQVLVWETCLRSIALSADPDDISRHEIDEIYSNQQAYRFMLEIMCGLHSPVVGETEVFGQFKNFARTWAAQQPGRATLIQKLLADAKEIRSKHLCNLGTQSYGSWLKRKVKADEIHILGAGNLTQEIVPYLLKKAAQVTVHVRSPEKVTLNGVTVKALSERAFEGGGLIVAAPLTASYIESWARTVPSEIFDLRDVSSSDPLKFNGNRTRSHVLSDVFSEIERTKALLMPIVDLVKSEILTRSEKIASQVHVRPQGWDDICA